MGAQGAKPSSGGQVVKRAVDVAQAVRIVAEAEVLAAGQIPGVVELIAVDGDSEQPRLVTARVGGPDLARAPHLTVEEVAGVVAAAATIVADLHELGLVHGAVMASHVLLGDDGRPVLCGFGYGGRVGHPPVAEAPLPQGCLDPTRRPGDPLAPSNDVYALGALLRALATDVAATTSRSRHVSARRLVTVGRRARRSRPGPARPARSDDRSLLAALIAVADRATMADPALRLGARSLAAAVGAAVPGARLPRQTHPRPAAEPARSAAPALPASRLRYAATPTRATAHRRRRTRLAIVAGTALATVSVVGRFVLGTAAGETSRAAAPAPPETSTTAGIVASTSPRSSVPPPATVVDPACPALTATLAADTDADGCSEALQWNDGILQAGDRRWSVGQAGDRVAAADWSCSGRPTLALLRPATGEVFVFEGWAQPGRDLVAEAVGRVEGGFAIRAADLGDGCPMVAVDRGDATPVTLPPRRRP